LYLKRNRQQYYQWLQNIRFEGDWEGWLKFFLDGVAQTASEACELAQQIRRLFELDRERLRALPRNGSVLDLHHYLQRNPFISVPMTSKALGLRGATVNLAIERLLEIGIVRETTGRKRGRVFVYAEYMRLLEQGTEPL
jgi:Fic family protein